VYSWNFADGVQIITGSYAVIGNVSTDATGAIENWYLQLGPLQQGCILEGGYETGSHTPQDQCEFDSGVGEILQDSNASWTMVTYQTPEPSTLALFGIGMVGLAGMARRRFLPICRK
jgi:hypothetical protein